MYNGIKANREANRDRGGWYGVKYSPQCAAAAGMTAGGANHNSGMRQATACFSGHRKIPAAAAAPLAAALRRTVEGLVGRGVTRFCAGGAQGFDMLAALTVLDAEGAMLSLVLPCRDQAALWQPEDVEFYKEVLAQADQVIYTAEKWTRGCYHLRNRRMVDESGVIVCYYTGEKGGTAYTVEYAKKHGLEIINLADLI